MENETSNKLWFWVRMCFPYLVMLAYTFLFLETFMYIGFVKHFILLNSIEFMIVTILLGILNLSFFLESSKYTRIELLLFDFNRLLLPVFLALYGIMSVSNLFRYQNYVYSVVHLQPNNFLYVLLFSFSLFLLDVRTIKSLFRMQLAKSLKRALFLPRKDINIRTNRFVSLLIFCFFAIIAFQQFLLFIPICVSTVESTISETKFSDIAKEKAVFGDFYIFIYQIKQLTSNSSIIYHSKEENPWYFEGNGAILRYFLYPRIIMDTDYYAKGQPGTVPDYVLAVGGWVSSASGENVYKYWPTNTIETLGIYALNERTGVLNKIDAKEYNSQLMITNQYEYVLLKVDKTKWEFF